ncbi:MAG TPA: hypothetical protein VKA15_12485 [Isosphaeraceae bacterium]|nr:hypothetical protein [Isosphaeraceae bacterium]
MAKVSGFHATSIQVADMLLREQTTWEASNNEYDWLGTGIYFWQDDPGRAWEWTAQRHWPHLALDTAVIEVEVELDECLDLIGPTYMELLAQAHRQLEAVYASRGTAMPENMPDGRHFLDHAVVNQVAENWWKVDTVRGLFIEGAPAYPGASFYSLQHIQIAVRNPERISIRRLVPRGGNS